MDPKQRLETRVIERADTLPALVMRQTRLVVENGPDSGTEVSFEGLSLRVGTDPDNDLILHDETVSGHHFELQISSSGVLIVDLESTNGTFVDGYKIGRLFLNQVAVINVGDTGLRFQALREEVEIPLSRSTNFGKLLGHSESMRAAFAILEKVARTDMTVLVTGESGTGKELAAEALHENSSRKRGPFVVFDCGSVSATLIESEIFGHARGAFTGAAKSRSGVFEAARSGTLVLDEIGDLPIELQPKLLRALETKTIRRLGETRDRSVDVRFVACTNRNLDEAVRTGSFREDLLFRLSVIAVRLPPLRERKEEIPRLVQHLLHLSKIGGPSTPEVPQELMQLLIAHHWPGNVRELKNVVDRFLVSPDDASIALLAKSYPNASEDRRWERLYEECSEVSYNDAKKRWNDYFEHRYISQLFEVHHGNVSDVARAAGLSRQSCYRLLEKHGLRSE